jgi:hypothetical protein
VDSLQVVWTGKGELRWTCPRGARSGAQHSDLRQWTWRDLRSDVAWLLENVYVVNGGEVWRQVIGMPMGTNGAPPLANLYLYAYESAFIDRLLVTQPEHARMFEQSFRLIDDVLSVDNAVVREYIGKSVEDGGIYPRALQLNETSVSPEEVHFLGMKICGSAGSNSLRIDVFDKRAEFAFAVLRYPHADSLMPADISYGVFTSQLHRYYRICTAQVDFVRNCAMLAGTMQRQGCTRGRLVKRFTAFLTSRPRLKWKTGHKNLCCQFKKLQGSC